MNQDIERNVEHLRSIIYMLEQLTEDVKRNASNKTNSKIEQKEILQYITSAFNETCLAYELLTDLELNM